MTKHYEQINTIKNLDRNSTVTKIVQKIAGEIMAKNNEFHEMNNTLTNFNLNNQAFNPTENPEKLFVNTDTLTKIIKALPTKTSTGPDNIPNILIKNLNRKQIQILTIIYNNALNHLYFPKAWKTAKLVCIYKKNKPPHDPASYRPISLLPNLGKILEKLITIPIKNFCSENKILPNEQFGFRDKHSTVHAIAKLTTDICNAINNEIRVGACLIDIEKCFDSIWSDGVIYKLIKKKFPEKLILLINHMIRNRQFYISEGEIKSSITGIIENGLQQGTIFSPTLFIITNSDVLFLYKINIDDNIKAIAFADDLIVYVIDRNIKVIRDKLEKIVNNIKNLYINCNLKTNADKCEIILFSKTQKNFSKNDIKNLREFKIEMIDVKKNTKDEIKLKKCVKYLGFEIDYLLRLNDQTDKQLTKAKNTFQALSKLFYSKHLNKKSKIICYMLFIRPLLTYAAPIWHNTSASVIEKLRVFERKCLRICLGMNRRLEHQDKWYYSNTVLYNTANIPRIDNFIIYLIRNYYISSKKITDNDVIKSLAVPLNENDFEKCIKTEYIPPQAFLNLDKKGYVQDESNVPILFHWRRNKANKRIAFEPDDYETINNNKVYSTAIPNIDKFNFTRINHNKMWWLHESDPYIKELNERYKEVLRSKINRTSNY